VAVDPVASSNNGIPSTTIDRTKNPAPVTNTSESASATKEATLNYDSFLKLLVAQMKNQDPTDPIDASEQMSQLATFSSVEQAIKTNTHLESLIQETSMSQAAALIGKTITSADGTMTGVVKSVAINSDGLTAVLQNGDKVLVTTGISISATASTDTGGGTDTTPDPTPGDGGSDSASGE
jgi:flagellar basal-body rod modification protein FlgD